MSEKRVLGEGLGRRVVESNAGDDIMRLSYGQISRLLTSILKVDTLKAVALSGRLKHFQRTGFPGGTNTGPGPRAVYRTDQIFALIFAFRLLAMRFPPRDAAAAVEANRDELRRMLVAAWRRRSRGDTGADADADADAGDDGPLLAGILPDGLEDLRRSDFGGGPADSLSRIAQRQVWSWMRGVDALPSPGLVLLDVDAIVSETLKAVEDLGLGSATDIANGFEELASQLVKVAD